MATSRSPVSRRAFLTSAAAVPVSLACGSSLASPVTEKIPELANPVIPPPGPTDAYHVLLIDPAILTRLAELAYSCPTRREANAWAKEWHREPLGMAAVIVPASLLPSVQGKAGA